MAYTYRTHTYQALLAAATMIASGVAFGQSSTMTAPNNSAGGAVGTPPNLTRPMATDAMPSSTESSVTAFKKMSNGTNGYVTRAEVQRLPGSADFDEADRNHDGRLNSDEFQRYWNDYQEAGK